MHVKKTMPKSLNNNNNNKENKFKIKKKLIIYKMNKEKILSVLYILWHLFTSLEALVCVCGVLEREYACCITKKATIFYCYMYV